MVRLLGVFALFDGFRMKRKQKRRRRRRRRRQQIRYGHLAVLKDVESLTNQKVAELAQILQAAKDADTGKSTGGEPINVLHVAVMEVLLSVGYDRSVFLRSIKTFTWGATAYDGPIETRKQQEEPVENRLCHALYNSYIVRQLT